MNTQKQIFLIVVLFFMLTGGCAAYAVIDPIRAGRQDDYFQAESVERGALLFANNCRACHGNLGEGGLGLPLNKPEFQDQNPATLEANRDLIRTTLYCGRATTAMPPWLNENGGSLTATQIEHLIDFITSPATITGQSAGGPTNAGWLHALEFAHNLNHEISVVVSGDTLDTIARQHQVGPAELAAFNGLEVDSPVERGDTFNTPDGRQVEIFARNETVTKLAERLHIGAIILADLNGIEWEVDGDGNFRIFADGQEVVGLLPGATLRLPESAVYAVRAGDTANSIATQHGITVAALRGANPESRELSEAPGADDPIPADEQLILPDGSSVTIQPGAGVGIVATQHGLEEAALLEFNGLTAESIVAPGDTLALPDGTRYTIQAGDTLATIADAHSMAPAELASVNGYSPEDSIDPAVILVLPPVEAYVVAGQSLETVAAGYGNVTASSLAEANEIPADAALRIGSGLVLPEDAWGTAPPNPAPQTSANVCVQHAVPQNVYDELTNPFEPVRPEEASSEVVIVGNANDWTITADGVELEPNRGTVLVAAGSTITFRSASAPPHTVTIDGTKDNGDLLEDDERDLTFDEPGSEFAITCDFHPAMRAWVYTE